MTSSVGMMTFPIYGKIIHSCSKPPISDLFPWKITMCKIATSSINGPFYHFPYLAELQEVTDLKFAASTHVAISHPSGDVFGHDKSMDHAIYRFPFCTRPGKRANTTNWKDPPFLMGKSTISMVIFMERSTIYFRAR